MRPFGLKNIGATYKQVMNTIFHEQIHKTVECYVDDIAVKSHDKGDQLANLKRVFDIMRASIEVESNKVLSGGGQWQIP